MLALKNKCGLLCVLICLFVVMPVANAYAQLEGADILKQIGDLLDPIFPTEGEFFSDTCTYHRSYWMPNMILPVIQGAVFLIDALVNESMSDLFDGIVSDTEFFAPAIGAAATLSVIFYGIGIIAGLFMVTLYDAVLRMVKLGFVLSLLSPNVWDLFDKTFVTFFQDGVMDLIAIVIDIGRTSFNVGPVGFSISTGGVGVAITSGAAGPLAMFADIANMLFSPRMWVLIQACFYSGSPYGFAIGVALVWAAYIGIMLFISVLEVYCISIIGRGILLGAAPLFFAFMMFKGTRFVFKGWLNQLCSFSLQPIFLFAFLSFFIGLIESAVNAAVPRGVVEACQVKCGVKLSGTNQDPQCWQFQRKGEIFEGTFGRLGAENNALNDITGWGTGFPIDVFSVIILLLVIYTGKSAVLTASAMANDLAEGAVSLISRKS